MAKESTTKPTAPAESREKLKRSPMGNVAAREVECPDCGAEMYACTPVVTTYSRARCANCQSAADLVREDKGVRHYRCPQKRHRVRMTLTERTAAHAAIVAQLDPKAPGHAGRLLDLGRIWFDEPARDALSRVVVDDPLTWQDAGRRSQFYHCPASGCRYARHTVDRKVGGRIVTEEAGMRHKVRLDEAPKWDFGGSKRCECGSIGTKLRSVKEQFGWRDCSDCGRSWKVQGTEI